MKRNNKKGFTVVELVIVIAVIAILSAVLIPTFAGISRKAKLSADEQAVRTINNELAGATDAELANLSSVEAYLTTLGLTIEDYNPVSKNYSLAYSSALKKVVLVDASKKVVYPKEYANEKVIIEEAGTSTIVAIKDADDVALVGSRGGQVDITTTVAFDAAMYTTKNLVINLSGTVSTPNDSSVGDGVFCAKAGTLTINGNGTVNGKSAGEYHMAVFADGGKIVINGGTYTNEGVTNSVGQDDLIYASHNGEIVINGGTFKCSTPEWTLNISNTKGGKIVVAGGSFYKFNPADWKSYSPIVGGQTLNRATETDDITVADGYRVVQDGDWYNVVPA